MTNNLYLSKEYVQSRRAYMAQCTIEYFISILVADAFLAKLLTHIGISDSLTGIISSFISFAFLFQLLSIWLVKKIKSTKKTVLVFDTLSQLFFMSIYIIPFLPVSRCPWFQAFLPLCSFPQHSSCLAVSAPDSALSCAARHPPPQPHPGAYFSPRGR